MKIERNANSAVGGLCHVLILILMECGLNKNTLKRYPIKFANDYVSKSQRPPRCKDNELSRNFQLFLQKCNKQAIIC